MDKKVRGDFRLDPDASQNGDFAALFAQLERPADAVSVSSGYDDLMARINSPAFRKRTGHN